MAFELDIPFYAFTLRFISGGQILVPMLDQNAWHYQSAMEALSHRYKRAFQKKVLDNGDYIDLLEEYQNGPFLNAQLIVEFEEDKRSSKYPAFQLSFEFFYTSEPENCWGIIPILGVEGFAPSLPELIAQLDKAVKLDFTRKKRLANLQGLVEAIWLEVADLRQVPIHLKTYSPQELEANPQTDQVQLLDKAAIHMQIKQKVVYHRDKELLQLSKALKNPYNRNILVVGQAGVGKTALIQEMTRIAKQEGIQQAFWETTSSRLIKALTLETGWQDNLVYLCRELKEKGVFLFVNNLMELFEIGQYEGNAVSVAEFLLPFISRGEITIISECTNEERANIELKSPNYLSFFQIIQLEEPAPEQAIQIIQQKVKDLSENYQVSLEEEAVLEVIRLNKRYTPYAGVPGKPIRFLENLLLQKSGAAKTEKADAEKAIQIDKSEVIHYFCQDTGMPAFMVDPTIPMDLDQVNRFFSENVFGQPIAVGSVTNVLATVKSSLSRSGKPIASFLFVGPTGVGKTELAKVLADFMFGSRDRMIRFDMSEYSSAQNVLRLTEGIGNGDGLLTSAVRREPFCVLLFDEIEKAHPDFSDLLLQVLGEGRLTDGRGKMVNFCSTIIIMTSNIGATRIQQNPISILMNDSKGSDSSKFMTAVEKHFRPELFNRIDQIIPFEALNADTVRHVVEREMHAFKMREGIQFRKLDLRLPEDIFDFLAQKGYDKKYGARQLQRTLQEALIIPLSKALNLEDPDDQLIVEVKVEGDHLDIKVQADPLGLDLLLEELSIINHADRCSDLRRRLQNLKEGHFYLRILSELDILDNTRQQVGEQAFWKKEKQSRRFTILHETVGKMKAIEASILKLEMEIGMACMGLSPYETRMEKDIDDWANRFKGFKLDLYRLLHPRTDHCYFGIYGSQCQEFIDHYLDIVRKKKWSVVGHTVWFREAHHSRVMKNYIPLGSKVFMAKEKYQDRLPYYYKAWDLQDSQDAFQADKPGDQLFGLEIMVSGPAVNLFLKSEGGIHEWELKNSNNLKFLLKHSNNAFETPMGIHRKDIYSEKPARRFLRVNSLKDTKFKIDREIDRSKQIELILEYLEEQFERSVQIALI